MRQDILFVFLFLVCEIGYARELPKDTLYLLYDAGDSLQEKRDFADREIYIWDGGGEAGAVNFLYGKATESRDISAEEFARLHSFTREDYLILFREQLKRIPAHNRSTLDRDYSTFNAGKYFATMYMVSPLENGAYRLKPVKYWGASPLTRKMPKDTLYLLYDARDSLQSKYTHSDRNRLYTWDGGERNGSVHFRSVRKSTPRTINREELCKLKLFTRKDYVAFFSEQVKRIPVEERTPLNSAFVTFCAGNSFAVVYMIEPQSQDTYRLYQVEDAGVIFD